MVMKNKQLLFGQKIYFVEEKLPMKIIAINDKFAICTRKFNKKEDDGILKNRVEMGAYLTKQDAYNDLKDETIYSCLDFINNMRGPHNLIFNIYDFNKLEDMMILLNDLTSGEVILSYRNSCKLKINYKSKQ